MKITAFASPAVLTTLGARRSMAIEGGARCKEAAESATAIEVARDRVRRPMPDESGLAPAVEVVRGEARAEDADAWSGEELDKVGARRSMPMPCAALSLRPADEAGATDGRRASAGGGEGVVATSGDKVAGGVAIIDERRTKGGAELGDDASTGEAPKSEGDTANADTGEAFSRGVVALTGFACPKSNQIGCHEQIQKETYT